jgi:hypothetical protein
VEIMPVLPIAGAQFLIFAPNQCGAESGSGQNTTSVHDLGMTAFTPEPDIPASGEKRT